jgi:hypothetical protein
VDKIESQRHTRSGAGRGENQANGAAIHSKLTGLCQHEIVSGILKNWKQCGEVQASCGCLVGHVCMGVCISVFAPQLCKTSVSILLSMQMDTEFKKAPSFVWWGHWKGGLGGAKFLRGVHPKKWTCLHTKKTPDMRFKQCCDFTP